MAGFKGLRHYTFVDYATQGYITLVGTVVVLCHNGTVPHWVWIALAHAAALPIIHGLIQWHGRHPKAPVLSFLRHFYPVLLYTGFFVETGALNRMFFPDYLDPIIIHWDQALFRCQPSVLFMQKLPYLAVSELFYASYFSYYIMIAGIGIALFIRDRRQFFHYVSIISFVFYICYAIYIVVPVIGPRVFFHEINGYSLPERVQLLASTDLYPENLKKGPFFNLMAFIYRVFEAPGSAIPSSHVAIALTTVFFSFRYLPRIRFIHLGVATLLCLSTVYCRYHYGADVLAGIATFALLVPLGNWLYGKYGDAGATDQDRIERAKAAQRDAGQGHIRTR